MGRLVEAQSWARDYPELRQIPGLKYLTSSFETRPTGPGVILTFLRLLAYCG